MRGWGSMADLQLFPHWRGRFEGMRPTISRMDGDAVLRTIDGTLLSDGEVNSLRHLIQSPDVRFHPLLPYCRSLTNIDGSRLDSPIS